MNVDVKKILSNMLEESTDQVMFMHGFKRRRSSFFYSRTIGTTKQKIEIISFSHPSYHPGALAHVYPWLSVSFPAVNEIASEMVEENLIANLKDITIRQPVQIYSDSECWVLMSDMESEKIAENMNKFFIEYTVPMLDDLGSVCDYIKLYEQKDKRLIMDDRQHIFVASAYVLEGDYEKAKGVLENRFGKTGVRKKYASAFDYLKGININKLENDKE